MTFWLILKRRFTTTDRNNITICDTEKWNKKILIKFICILCVYDVRMDRNQHVGTNVLHVLLRICAK